MYTIEYKKYNSWVRRYNVFLHELEYIYEDYKSKHENKLKAVQNNIDKINKKKSYIKEYILNKLSIKLREMGIDNTVSDYPLEHIDYRHFDLKKEYNLIQQKMLVYKEEIPKKDILICPHGNSIWEKMFNYACDMAIAEIESTVRDNWKANKIKNKLTKLRTEQGGIESEMHADLTQLEELNNALENIANIFSETSCTLVPLLEKIIKNISDRYINNYNEIPDEILQMMHSASKIMKEMTEKRIIPENVTIMNTDDVDKYSKKLTQDYNSINNNINAYAAYA